MKYTPEEVMDYIREEDIKFIRLAFCDVYGRQRNAAIMDHELERAFEHGIAFDASAVEGFGGGTRSDLFLRPDPATLKQLPWRPRDGGVAHMFCDIVHPDGTPFAGDTRYILKKTVLDAQDKGCRFHIGSEIEFYLFKLDENGEPTKIPYDRAGYMDIAPADRGENVRREICLTLERMGILPEASHHESGPGQNEIDFRYADPLTAADNAVTFRAVVGTIAMQYGLWADFSPRPLENHDGSGMHINISASVSPQPDPTPYLIAGILRRAREMTRFLNPLENSYERLGRDKAPHTVTWSNEDRSRLIRIPAAAEPFRRLELRSPDPAANPYLAFSLVIRACLEGLTLGLTPPPAEGALADAPVLPASLSEAKSLARSSVFIESCLPEEIIAAYC